MARTPQIPKYRRHTSGQARVTLGGKDILLGPYNSAASREAYDRKITEWLSSPSKQLNQKKEADPLTISELILAYWKFATKHYGFNAGHGRGDYYCLRDALKIVRTLYGRTVAKEFGPLALKACRQKMIQKDWSRKYINSQVDRIRRVFRWAAEEELLPGRVHQDLRAVILIVWATVIWCVVAVWPVYKWVGAAQVPYFVWVSIASVLQLSITVMNWGRP